MPSKHELVIKKIFEQIDLGKIDSLRALGQAYQLLFELAVTASTGDKSVEDTLKLCLKIIDSYAKTMKDYLRMEFPEAVDEQVSAKLQEIQDVLEEMGHVKTSGISEKGTRQDPDEAGDPESQNYPATTGQSEHD